jgi:hypothetical protein
MASYKTEQLQALGAKPVGGTVLILGKNTGEGLRRLKKCRTNSRVRCSLHPAENFIHFLTHLLTPRRLQISHRRFQVRMA